MHIGWHDDPKNSPGSLTTNLETKVTSVGQMAGISLGLIIQMLMTNIIAVLFALAMNWQLGLIGAVIVLVLLFVGVNMNSNDAKGQEKGAQVLSKTEVLISETINNMKTVASLNAQNKFLSTYGTVIKEYYNIRLKTKFKNGLLKGGLFFVMFIDLGVMCYIGTKLFTQGVSPTIVIYAGFSVPILAIKSIKLFTLLPDVSKATSAIQSLFHSVDLKSEIDIEDKNASFKGKIQGNIEFKNVSFSYPTRKTKVFNDLSFKIDSGKHIGLAGPNGSGKSTITQLLLMLYDVSSGEILIDGVNIKEYDLHYLRRNIGIVSQEPVLFYGSIEYNLKYANQEVSDVEMKEAINKVNALEFIENDENGFQRIVGAKGGQLSGGQKQRIAIARALLRKPRILILDEATSALDFENESIIQYALTKIPQEITTISIAHKLNILKEVDEILVFKEGLIVEKSQYDQLIQKQGHFYQLKEALSSQ